MNVLRPSRTLPRLALAAFTGFSGLFWGSLFAMPLAALEQSETVTRTFTLAAVSGQRTLVVDNVSGSIEIEAASGDSVQLTLKQTFVARNAAEMARARAEVVLEVTENPGRLELVQGGPWRCKGRDRRKHGDCCCDHDDRDYEVRFDWTLSVPKNLDLEVDNVNEGAIRITGTVGRLTVDHVNDDVTLVRVAGAVDARTVNGELKVDFAALPAGDCRFGTVNGDIDLAFPKGLGAELSFETMNGEVYTDFPFELAKLRPTSARSQSGRGNHHELGGNTEAVIGGGGVALACSTINGDITIRERS
ncbi:MAG: hypothetical protein ABIV06_09640 [Thermoanaerobaculia bacterium]